MTAGHKGGAVTSTFFTTRHAGADVKDSLLTECGAAAGRVPVLRIPAIDDDVTVLQEFNQLIDESIYRFSG